MAPLITNRASTVVSTSAIDTTQGPRAGINALLPEVKNPREPYRRKIVWRNVVIFIYLNAAALYLTFTSAKLLTIIFGYLLGIATGLSVTTGAHRLWSHRAYKARMPLRVLLMIFNTLAFQNHIHEWACDHRVHHKYSETDADPHNATRGFFSHVGWLLCRKHPNVKEKGKSVEMHDLDQDKVVQFQKKYYLVLVPLISLIIPTIIPMYFWGETLSYSWHVAILFRYALSLNITWLVNSAAHLWGNHPYDKNIYPPENWVVVLGTLGDGWHNYHHVFPWDYKTAKLGNYRANFTTAFINFMSKIGWAYDLKTVPVSMIQKRVEHTGDGTQDIWGWGDKDISKEEMKEATIENRKIK